MIGLFTLQKNYQKIRFQDSLDDNYHEFDRQKLLTLYDAIGIPENIQAAI